MVLDRYIQVSDAVGIAGQKSNGSWYCKELPFNNAHDLKVKAVEIIKVLNELNAVSCIVETEKKQRT